MRCGPSLEQRYVFFSTKPFFDLKYSQQGHINLFTVRHDPGQLCYVMYGHRGPVSSLSMQYDEKGFFSAGWDGEALVSGA